MQCITWSSWNSYSVSFLIYSSITIVLVTVYYEEFIAVKNYCIYILYIASLRCVDTCNPNDTPTIRRKHYGETFEFLCSSGDTCVGTMYNYYFYNDTSTTELVHQGQFTHNFQVYNFGIYCCIKQCAENYTMPNDSQCCYEIVGEFHFLCNH